MRPCELTFELKMKLAAYVHGGYVENGDVIPSAHAFALLVGQGSSTFRQWVAEDRDPEFTALYRQLMDAQAAALVNNGLTGKFNPSITGLLLGKHGYSNKTDHTSSDGSMTPQPVSVIERRIVKAKKNDQTN